jgi:hypothetical protein
MEPANAMRQGSLIGALTATTNNVERLGSSHRGSLRSEHVFADVCKAKAPGPSIAILQRDVLQIIKEQVISFHVITVGQLAAAAN